MGSADAAMAGMHSKRSLKCIAWATNSYPAVGTSVGIRVHTVPHARIKAVAHYKAIDDVRALRAGAKGRHTFWYYLANPKPGYRVTVTVRVLRHGRKGSCRTSFTPHRVSQPSPSPSPTTSPTPTPKPTPSPTPTPTPTHSSPPPPSAWCSASVYTRMDSDHDEWLNDVYVNSNQLYTEAYASADGYSWSYETNGSGYADIWLNGPGPGAAITVTVGSATCYTSS
jgi:hypothetical protein